MHRVAVCRRARRWRLGAGVRLCCMCTLRVGPYCSVRRWRVSALGVPCDVLGFCVRRAVALHAVAGDEQVTCSEVHAGVPAVYVPALRISCWEPC